LLRFPRFLEGRCILRVPEDYGLRAYPKNRLAGEVVLIRQPIGMLSS
jgi:hypothetical protein